VAISISARMGSGFPRVMKVGETKCRVLRNEDTKDYPQTFETFAVIVCHFQDSLAFECFQKEA
jgi:hypothetical protein